MVTFKINGAGTLETPGDKGTLDPEAIQTIAGVDIRVDGVDFIILSIAQMGNENKYTIMLQAKQGQSDSDIKLDALKKAINDKFPQYEITPEMIEIGNYKDIKNGVPA